MATGLIATDDGSQIVIRLLDAATATNSTPSSYAAAGVDVGAILDGLYGAKARPTTGWLHTYTTAGSGTMTATVKTWVGLLTSGSTGRYSAGSPGAAATAGVRNGGAAFDEHATDNINRIETVYLDRIMARKQYEELTAIGGTATAVTIDLVLPAVVS